MTNNTPDYNDNLFFEEKKMNDLTEQWIKGELPAGWYYIKCGDGGIYPSENCLNYDCLNDRAYSDFYYAEDEIEEIVDKVPSYEKWIKFQNVTADKMLQNSELEIENIKLKRENAQRKELLKEVKDYLPEFETPMDILAKIDEALQ